MRPPETDPTATRSSKKRKTMIGGGEGDRVAKQQDKQQNAKKQKHEQDVRLNVDKMLSMADNDRLTKRNIIGGLLLIILLLLYAYMYMYGDYSRTMYK